MTTSMNWGPCATVVAIVITLAACNSMPSSKSSRPLPPATKPENYRFTENASLARRDVKVRVGRRIAALHPDVRDALEAAFDGGRRIISAKLAQPPRPVAPAQGAPYWTAVLVGVDGRVKDVVCADGTGEPADEATTKLIAEAMRQWRFTPATVDGTVVEYMDAFRVIVAGTSVFPPPIAETGAD